MVFVGIFKAETVKVKNFKNIELRYESLLADTFATVPFCYNKVQNTYSIQERWEISVLSDGMAHL